MGEGCVKPCSASPRNIGGERQLSKLEWLAFAWCDIRHLVRRASRDRHESFRNLRTVLHDGSSLHTPEVLQLCHDWAADRRLRHYLGTVTVNTATRHHVRHPGTKFDCDTTTRTVSTPKRRQAHPSLHSVRLIQRWYKGREVYTSPCNEIHRSVLLPLSAARHSERFPSPACEHAGLLVQYGCYHTGVPAFSLNLRGPTSRRRRAWARWLRASPST